MRRSGWYAGRLGEDEFLILGPVTDPFTAERAVWNALDEISTPIVDLGLPHRLGGTSVSVSAGIAMACPVDGWSSQLRKADIALYHAKAKKRGSTVMFRDGMRHPLAPTLNTARVRPEERSQSRSRTR